jgi:hypothetical protein
MVTKYENDQKTSATEGGIHSRIWLGSFKALSSDSYFLSFDSLFGFPCLREKGKHWVGFIQGSGCLHPRRWVRFPVFSLLMAFWISLFERKRKEMSDNLELSLAFLARIICAQAPILAPFWQAFSRTLIWRTGLSSGGSFATDWTTYWTPDGAPMALP